MNRKQWNFDGQTAKPSFDRVTVNFAADNGSFMETYRGIRLDPDYLIFDNTSSDNWSTPQTIQVVSYDDHLDEGGAAKTIKLSMYG